MYALRLLKGTRVMPEDILKVYTYNIRSLLEYAVQVWQHVLAYLSDAIDSIQRRAVTIIFPNSSYQQALDQANLTSLADHRIFTCKKLMADMRNESHPISFLALQVMTRSIPYQLRSVVSNCKLHRLFSFKTARSVNKLLLLLLLLSLLRHWQIDSSQSLDSVWKMFPAYTG